MTRKIDGRVAYADLLRSVAVIAVILLQIAYSRLVSVPVNTSAWTVYNAYTALTRWSVPAFVMLSGAFLLDPKKSGKLSVLFLRILRIFLVLVVWSAVYAMADHLDRGGNLSLRGFQSALMAAVRGDVHGHLWFLYMILGLYLVTPILRAFIKGASRATLHYFLILTFVVTSLLPTFLKFYPGNPLSTHLNRVELYLVLGYVGYFVAGYYLKTYTINRLAEAIIYVLGIAGAFATLWGTWVLSHRGGQLNEILYGYLTPNVCATTVALFVLFRYVLGISEERGRNRRMIGVARITLGIYVLHELFIMLLRNLGVFAIPLTPVVAVPAFTAVVFLLSFAAAWLLSKIPFVGPYFT